MSVVVVVPMSPPNVEVVDELVDVELVDDELLVDELVVVEVEVVELVDVVVVGAAVVVVGVVDELVVVGAAVVDVDVLVGAADVLDEDVVVDDVDVVGAAVVDVVVVVVVDELTVEVVGAAVLDVDDVVVVGAAVVGVAVVDVVVVVGAAVVDVDVVVDVEVLDVVVVDDVVDVDVEVDVEVVVDVVVDAIVVVEVVVVSGGVAHVPSSAQASNVLNNPTMAPQALPLVHFSADPTTDAFTLPFFLRTQHTTAPGLPQVDAPSHFPTSLRHALSGMRAVTLASLSAPCTHFLYFLCVWPSRVQPHVSWMMLRACSIASVSEHFELVHCAKPRGARRPISTTVNVAAYSDRMFRPSPLMDSAAS